MKYTFSGPTEQVYPQYLDVAEGHTLCAQPGGTYEIAQADGLIFPDGKGGFVDAVMPMPPDEQWSKATKPAADTSKETG